MRYYNGINHMQNYEMARMGQFGKAERGYHSNEDFRTAYFLWSEAPPGTRQKLWFEYCDIRDGFKLGTNANIIEGHKQQRGSLNEPRYIADLK